MNLLLVVSLACGIKQIPLSPILPIPTRVSYPGPRIEILPLQPPPFFEGVSAVPLPVSEIPQVQLAPAQIPKDALGTPKVNDLRPSATPTVPIPKLTSALSTLLKMVDKKLGTPGDAYDGEVDPVDEPEPVVEKDSEQTLPEADLEKDIGISK